MASNGRNQSVFWPGALSSQRSQGTLRGWYKSQEAKKAATPTSYARASNVASLGHILGQSSEDVAVPTHTAAWALVSVTRTMRRGWALSSHCVPRAWGQPHLARTLQGSWQGRDHQVSIPLIVQCVGPRHCNIKTNNRVSGLRPDSPCWESGEKE